MQRSGRRIGTLAALAGASLCAVALEAMRIRHTGTLEHWWLVWNLGLAWIPFVLALVLYDWHRRGVPGLVLAPIGALWLLFFPNAPYILTDFVHLAPAVGVPLWLDAGLISMFAFTGLLLGYASLYLVQVVVREVAGAAAAWAAALGALGLASVGIYLGRFVRLNSWDVLTDPGFVLGLARVRLAEPLGNPELIAVTGFFTVFLTLMYLVIYGLAGLGLEAERRG
jgi:uncharacterized membrane protein